MNFREIGKFVSEDQFSLDYLLKKLGIPFVHLVHPLNSTISPSQWISLVKLFELSTSARKVSQEVYFRNKTTSRAYDIFRRVLVEELAKTDVILKGELEADEAYFGRKKKEMRGRGAEGKMIIYRIPERGGRGSVNIVQDASADSLITETLKRVRRGSIVYTEKWRGYDSLLFRGYKHLNIYHRYKCKQGKVCISGIEGFWSSAKERLIKPHGISRKKIPLLHQRNGVAIQ